MKKVYTFGLCLTAFLTPESVNAAGWSNNATVSRLYARSEGHVFVKFSGTLSNPDHCTQQDWYVLEPNNSGFEQIYSALMASKFANEPAQVYLQGCSRNKPKIAHLIAQ